VPQRAALRANVQGSIWDDAWNLCRRSSTCRSQSTAFVKACEYRGCCSLGRLCERRRVLPCLRAQIRRLAQQLSKSLQLRRAAIALGLHPTGQPQGRIAISSYDGGMRGGDDAPDISFVPMPRTQLNAAACAAMWSRPTSAKTLAPGTCNAAAS
jgi:hypothetical protein